MRIKIRPLATMTFGKFVKANKLTVLLEERESVIGVPSWEARFEHAGQMVSKHEGAFTSTLYGSGKTKGKALEDLETKVAGSRLELLKKNYDVDRIITAPQRFL